MVATWKTEKTGEVACECGRVYERSVTRLPMRDKDSFKCPCGHILESWNSTHAAHYELKKDIER